MCDGDDYWCNCDKLQKQVDFLEKKQEYSACAHNMKIINCITLDERLYNNKISRKDIRFEEIIQHWGEVFQMSTLVYRSEFSLERAPEIFKTKGFGDYPLAIYLSIMGKIHYFPDVMSVYRYMSSDSSWTSMTAKWGKKKQIEHYKVIKKLLEGVDEFTNRNYHVEIEKTIMYHEYGLCLQYGFYKTAIVKCKGIIAEQTFLAHLKLYMLAYCAKLYETYEQYLKKRIRKHG